MTIKINFIPSFIASFVKASCEDGSYYGVVFDYAWGDKEVLSNCKDYFVKKIESQDLKRGLLFIEKSTLKYEILDVSMSR